jgi:hypothetical protein
VSKETYYSVKRDLLHVASAAHHGGSGLERERREETLLRIVYRDRRMMACSGVQLAFRAGMVGQVSLSLSAV